jgi:predicted homoserine dehydrogenase-like protein
VKKGQSLSWADVAIDRTTAAYKLRSEMEAMFAPSAQAMGAGGTAPCPAP